MDDKDGIVAQESLRKLVSVALCWVATLSCHPELVRRKANERGTLRVIAPPGSKQDWQMPSPIAVAAMPGKFVSGGSLSDAAIASVRDDTIKVIRVVSSRGWSRTRTDSGSESATDRRQKRLLNGRRRTRHDRRREAELRLRLGLSEQLSAR